MQAPFPVKSLDDKKLVNSQNHAETMAYEENKTNDEQNFGLVSCLFFGVDEIGVPKFDAFSTFTKNSVN